MSQRMKRTACKDNRVLLKKPRTALSPKSMKLNSGQEPRTALGWDWPEESPRGISQDQDRQGAKESVDQQTQTHAVSPHCVLRTS